MSYDLFVFDPKVAPRDRDAFLAWYKGVIQWQEPRDYNSPDGMTGNLPEFYDRMRVEFPAMNGPFGYREPEPAPKGFLRRIFAPEPPEPIDEAMLTDYSCAKSAIYLSFRSSVSSRAYNRTFNTALSTGVGFFNASAANGEILHDPAQFDALMGL